MVQTSVPAAAAPAPTVADLRRLLAERFPTAARPAPRVLPTGLPTLDAPAGGGLPQAALTELVCPAPASGAGPLLAALLARTRAERLRVALLDAADAFAPDEFAPDALHHLVWARVPPDQPRALWLAADLLCRELHFALVVLDLRGHPAADLRHTPPTTWHRLRLALEHSGAAALALTPWPLVPCAALRLTLDHPLALPDLARPRADLVADLRPRASRARLFHAAGA